MVGDRQIRQVFGAATAGQRLPDTVSKQPRNAQHPALNTVGKQPRNAQHPASAARSTQRPAPSTCLLQRRRNAGALLQQSLQGSHGGIRLQLEGGLAAGAAHTQQHGSAAAQEQEQGTWGGEQ